MQKDEEVPPPPPPPPPPPAPPQEGASRVYKVAEITQAPRAVSQPLPPYTREARDAQINGIVLLEVIILRDGSVRNIKVIRGLGYGLDESAVRTLSQWRFKPGTLKGKPVDVRANVEISFRGY